MNKTDKLHIASWSGGKDSTATIILAHINNEPLDLILISLVWFDKERKIYGERPETIAWIFGYAKPLFESWGYKVEIISSEKDYLHFFHKIRQKSKYPEYVGKKYGFLLGGMCKMNPEKVEPIKKYLKALNTDYVEYVGIAIDEPSRLERLNSKDGKISLLEKYGYNQADTRALCDKYNLLAPYYKISRRGGCWFCPNQGIPELADLKIKHPELYNELLKLSVEENTIQRGFKYGIPFEEINAQVDSYINNPPPKQLTLFDYIEEANL